MDAYSKDQCPADNEHAGRVLRILSDLKTKEEATSSAARIQAATEGSQIAKGALKWAKQQVQTLPKKALNSQQEAPVWSAILLP